MAKHSPSKLSHLDDSGRARMVDVSDKPTTIRMARAEATVRLGKTLATQVRKTGRAKKGEVVETARIAGIMGAKRAADLIPLCHPLALTGVAVDAHWKHDGLRFEATARTTGPTGVEMEALAAVTVAALTVYDMCKAASKDITITGIRLLEKSGGRSGHFAAKDETHGRKN
jgi:cyclic pyranopterin phosphate synthase